MVIASLLKTGAADERPAGVPVDEAWRSWWAALDGVERSRARKRWWTTISAAVADDEAVTAVLRSSLRRRAHRLVWTAAAVDLPDLAVDERLDAAGVSLPGSGISAGGLLEAYVREQDVPGVRQEFLLRGADRAGPPPGGRTPVVLHVIPPSTPGRVPTAAPLVLACDLAQWRSPREGRAGAGGAADEHDAGGPYRVIELPVMTADREAAWSTLPVLHERLPEDWTLVGGQMVRRTRLGAATADGRRRHRRRHQGARRRWNAASPCRCGSAPAWGGSGDPVCRERW